MYAQYPAYPSTPAKYIVSSIENANNPVGATMKYRVIYFKYLD